MKNHIDLNRAIIRGDAGRKVLWQPRIICWYDDRRFQNEPLPAPYTGMDIRQLYEALGCSNRIYDYNCAVELIEPADVKRFSQPIDEMASHGNIDRVKFITELVEKHNAGC